MTEERDICDQILVKKDQAFLLERHGKLGKIADLLEDFALSPTEVKILENPVAKAFWDVLLLQFELELRELVLIDGVLGVQLQHQEGNVPEKHRH